MRLKKEGTLSLKKKTLSKKLLVFKKLDIVITCLKLSRKTTTITTLRMMMFSLYKLHLNPKKQIKR